jgi:hypothetical protein
MPSGFLANQGVIQRSFGGGELAPALHARADQVKYATGLKTCRNFLVMRSGGAANRAGTRFIQACKTASPEVQILPYYSENAGESLLIEAGATYLRFYKNGGQVDVVAPAAWAVGTPYVNGDIVQDVGINYYAIIASLGAVPAANPAIWYPMPGNRLELPSPFPDLFYWSQSGRTITMTHVDVQPYELTFVELTRWTLKKVDTKPTVTPPLNVALTPGGAGTRRFAYVVTAAGADYEESEASGQVINAACAAPTPDAPHVITWDPVAGSPEYYVYGDPYFNNTYGFLGTATGQTTFRDVGFVPDFTITPPIARVLFATVNNFPKVSASYQQRRFFGHTKASPDRIDGSRIGFPVNFGISSPLQDDDALTFRLAANQHQPIRHLVGVKQLVVLTDAGEWNVRGGQDGVLTPSAINADQQTYAGCSDIRPVVIGNSIIYVQARGSILRDLRFDIEVEGLAGRDLTVFSSHLFDGRTIRRLDYAQVPHSIVWAVRDDGVLLGMTYIRELDVWGWHRHDTNQPDGTSGFFWDVCVVPEAAGDVVYFIVRRTIDGNTVRYIEKLEKREIDVALFDAQAFFVDAGLSYSGAPANNVTGLQHLEGQVCAVLGDGAVIYNGDPAGAQAANFTVTAGGTFPVDFPASYANIHVGLRIIADLETLDLDVEGGNVRDKMKGVGPVQLLIDRSSRTFQAGPDSAHLRAYAPPTWEPGADEFTGQVEISPTKVLNKYGRVFVRQSDPLPLTILGIIPNVELGG